MTPDELLRPRYKVIADWPGSMWAVGRIMDLYNFDDGKTIDVWIKYFDTYPHLFQKLEWWQERAESDLPEYIQYVRDGKKLACYKVHGWNIKEAYAISERGADYPLYLQKHTVPATREEYNQYQSSIKHL